MPKSSFSKPHTLNLLNKMSSNYSNIAFYEAKLNELNSPNWNSGYPDQKMNKYYYLSSMCSQSNDHIQNNRRDMSRSNIKIVPGQWTNEGLF